MRGDQGKTSVRGRALLIVAGSIALVALLWIMLGGGATKPSSQLLHISGTTMATSYSVKVVGRGFSTGQRERLEELIERELEGVNACMSRYLAGSDLDRLNRSRSTAAQPIPAQLAEILELASLVSELSQGAFDVTVGPLVRLWGFDDKQRLARAPDEEQAAEVRRRVGFDKLVVDATGVTARKLHPELDIDLSSIAKGWAVDRVGRALESAGQLDHLVEIGGEVRAAGLSHRGEAWRVGIEKPLDQRREVLEVVRLSNMALATSGDYRDFYMLDGRRVSHTIDPRTGRPVEHDLASVTVLDPSCARADALATALTVLGPVEGPALAEREKMMALFLIRREDGTFERRATAAFDGR